MTARELVAEILLVQSPAPGKATENIPQMNELGQEDLLIKVADENKNKCSLFQSS